MLIPTFCADLSIGVVVNQGACLHWSGVVGQSQSLPSPGVQTL